MTVSGIQIQSMNLNRFNYGLITGSSLFFILHRLFSFNVISDNRPIT